MIQNRAVIVRDRAEEEAAVEIEWKDAGARDTLEIPLRAGGGLGVMFTR